MLHLMIYSFISYYKITFLKEECIYLRIELATLSYKMIIKFKI